MILEDLQEVRVLTRVSWDLGALSQVPADFEAIVRFMELVSYKDKQRESKVGEHMMFHSADLQESSPRFMDSRWNHGSRRAHCWI